MSSLEETIERACINLEIPGIVLQAANRDGSFHYSRSFGKRSVRTGADQSALKPDSVMWIASCTKLMTSICCMQLIEQGHIGLHTPIYTILPELKDLPVITGFQDTGAPILEPHKPPITLRYLLTHSSGLSYDETHPKLIAWRKWEKKKASFKGTVVQRYAAPLTFEPGTNWSYGPGVDWAGKLVERISGKSLEEFMRENLWGRIGVKDITFKLHRRKDLESRLADMSKRDPKDAKRVIRSNAHLHFLDENREPVEDCMGGLGCFASPEAYFEFLRAFLTTDRDGRLLKRENVEEFFKPQLTEKSKKALNRYLMDQQTNNAMGGTAMDIEKSWGLGGLLTLGEVEGGRRKGTMTWGGLPNLTWFVDREAGLCGLYAGQLLPPGDLQSATLNQLFEKTMYERMRSGSAKL